MNIFNKQVLDYIRPKTVIVNGVRPNDNYEFGHT